MNIITHFPEAAEDKNELAKRIAEIHAHIVTDRINDLSLPEKNIKKLCERINSDITAGQNISGNKASYQD